MRVHIERVWQRQELDIWIWDRAGKFATFATVGDDGRLSVEWKEEPEGTFIDDRPPTLRLQPEVLEAIIRAAEGHVHPQDATTRHLDDATATRDRLLTMIETRGLR